MSQVQIPNSDHCIWQAWINHLCKSGLDPIDCKSSCIHWTQNRHYLLLLLLRSNACAIEMENSVIITGGYYSYTRVARYNHDGYLEDLPGLITGRSDHACGHYIDTQNNIVSFPVFYWQLIIICKVLLVTGGQKSDFSRTDSTEILSEASSQWRLAQPLPTARSGLRIAQVDGRLLAIGDLSQDPLYASQQVSKHQVDGMEVMFSTQCWVWTFPRLSGAKRAPPWCPGPGTRSVRSPTGKYRTIVPDF